MVLDAEEDGVDECAVSNDMEVSNEEESEPRGLLTTGRSSNVPRIEKKGHGPNIFVIWHGGTG